MKKIITLFAVASILTSCQFSPKLKVKENLDSRFTGYDIVEIKPDSSFIYHALNELSSLKLKVSQWNLDIIKSISNYETGNSNLTGKQTYLHIDSVFTEMENTLTAFENKRFLKSEPCYYVKYRVYNGVNKVEKEEYFYFHKYDNNKTEVLTRPCDWDEFMYQEDYKELIDDALKFYSDILDYRHKYTGKY